jgi:hypothetical protein
MDTPASTAGGNNDAEMATPTRDAVCSSKIDTATPRPEKNATGRAIKKLLKFPLFAISAVGHFSASDVHPVHAPITIPIAIQNSRLMHSLRSDFRTNAQFQMIVPYPSPIQGPMIGETNLLAMIVVILFATSPRPANIEATRSNTL